MNQKEVWHKSYIYIVKKIIELCILGENISQSYFVIILHWLLWKNVGSQLSFTAKCVQTMLIFKCENCSSSCFVLNFLWLLYIHHIKCMINYWCLNPKPLLKIGMITKKHCTLNIGFNVFLLKWNAPHPLLVNTNFTVNIFSSDNSESWWITARQEAGRHL